MWHVCMYVCPWFSPKLLEIDNSNHFYMYIQERCLIVCYHLEPKILDEYVPKLAWTSPPLTLWRSPQNFFGGDPPQEKYFLKKTQKSKTFPFLSSLVFSPSACTVPHDPFQGGRTLDTSLRPWGGVWGGTHLRAVYTRWHLMVCRVFLPFVVFSGFSFPGVMKGFPSLFCGVVGIWIQNSCMRVKRRSHYTMGASPKTFPYCSEWNNINVTI